MDGAKSKQATKISASRAHEEASMVIGKLSRSPGQAGKLASDLRARFSPAALRSIMEAQAKAAMPGQMSPAALFNFLRSLTAGMKPSAAQHLFMPSIKLVMTLPHDAAQIVAADLVVAFIDRRGEGLKKITASDPLARSLMRELGTSGRSPVAVVATLLDRAGPELATEGLFSLMAATLAPAIARSKPAPDITPLEAGRVLALVERSSANAPVPPEMLLALVPLLSMAEPEAAERFSLSPTGKRVRKFSSGTLAAQGQEDQPARERSRRLSELQGGQLEILDSILAEFERARAAERDASEALAGAQESLVQKDVDLANLRASKASLRDRLQDDIDSKQIEIDDLKQTLSDTTERAGRWETEATHREHTAKTRLEIDRDARDGDLRTRLSRPLRDVRQHLVNLLTEPEDRNRERLVAIAFDNLVRQINRVTKSGIDQLPAELLRGNTAGGDEGAE